MNKVIINACPKHRQEFTAHSLSFGYEAVCDVPAEELPQLLREQHDIFALFCDMDFITPYQLSALREAVNDPTFPIVLLTDALTGDDTGKWIGAGATEIITLPMPVPLMHRRIGNVIKLHHLSLSITGQERDALTGLYNRGAFFHYAQVMMKEDASASYTIAISDIENFRLINERYGEKKGDELLRYVGHFLSNLHHGNMLFARYSGDQFVCLARYNSADSGLDENEFAADLQRMYANAPVPSFSVKFGIYENVDTVLPVSIMCDRALMALRTVKHLYGRDAAKYTPLMQQSFNREQRILDSMEEALRTEQFEVYYQPKHAAATSEIIGVEALVRWIHPIYGFMSPGEFIPLFEKNGFVCRLDRYVWRRVCRDINEWLRQGFPAIPVSVNVSRMDLLQPGFVSDVILPIQEYNINTDLLHMEITESIYIEDEESLSPVITQLKDIGIKIELDDFGSGFSSIDILSKLPLDIIKLDIKLIRNLETNPLIVKSIVQFMHTLGYTVIAEGVETDAQLEQLKNMKCDYIQGYCYSKPLTLNGLKEYVAQYQK